MATSPRHIFAMKAPAARTRDIDDLRLLAGIVGVESADAALQICANFYPDEPVSPRSAAGDHRSNNSQPCRLCAGESVHTRRACNAQNERFCSVSGVCVTDGITWPVASAVSILRRVGGRRGGGAGPGRGAGPQWW
jgi:hypothetical protein